MVKYYDNLPADDPDVRGIDDGLISHQFVAFVTFLHEICGHLLLNRVVTEELGHIPYIYPRPFTPVALKTTNQIWAALLDQKLIRKGESGSWIEQKVLGCGPSSFQRHRMCFNSDFDYENQVSNDIDYWAFGRTFPLTKKIFLPARDDPVPYEHRQIPHIPEPGDAVHPIPRKLSRGL